MDCQSQKIPFFPEISPAVNGSALKSGSKYNNWFLGKKTGLPTLHVQDYDMTYFFCLVPSQNERLYQLSFNKNHMLNKTPHLFWQIRYRKNHVVG